MGDTTPKTASIDIPPNYSPMPNLKRRSSGLKMSSRFSVLQKPANRNLARCLRQKRSPEPHRQIARRTSSAARTRLLMNVRAAQEASASIATYRGAHPSDSEAGSCILHRNGCFYGRGFVSSSVNQMPNP